MSPKTFSVLTYNVLHSFGASRLLAGRSAAGGGALWPQERVLAMAQVVHRLRPDVACLQEVDDAAHAALEQVLGEDFECAAWMRNEALPPKDGCSIFVRRSRFQVLRTHTFRLRDTIETHCPGIAAADPSRSAAMGLAAALWRELREKLSLGVVVRLQGHANTESAVDEPTVCVATSHLYWDPKFPDLKLLQAFLLAKEVERFNGEASHPSGEPVVLAGDFNSTPFREETGLGDSKSGTITGVYELLTRGSVSVTHPDHPVTLRQGRGILAGVHAGDVPELQLAHQYRSAYDEANGVEGPITNVSKTFRGCLDYIMHRPGGGGLHRGGCRLVRVEPLPSFEELLPHLPLPSVEQPSDHLPLLAEFEFAPLAT